MEEIFKQLIEKLVTNSPLVALAVIVVWKLGKAVGSYIDGRIDKVLNEFACQGETKKEMAENIKKLYRVQMKILSFVSAIDRRKESQE